MNTIEFKIEINAPVEKVYKTMIGIETYRIWTAAFNPTSDFEGGWNKGDKIYFIGFHEGKKGGMIAEIKENIPNEFISIHHIGVFQEDQEILEGPAVEGWGDALENYSFSESNGATTVQIHTSAPNEYLDYFNEAWPKALQILKEICEK